MQKKIKENQPITRHEEEFITRSILQRLELCESVSIDEEALVLLNDTNRFEYFLFRYDDKRFARMFEHFAEALDDNGIRLIFSKAPARMTKCIASGSFSGNALSRIRKVLSR